jgi:iron complex outermembrane receptor protein
MVVAQGSSANRGATAGGFVALPFGHVGNGHLAFRAEGSARTGGDLRTPVGVLGNTDLRTYNGAASVALVGERGHAGVSYRAYANDYGIPGGFVGAHPNGVDVRMRRQMVRAEGGAPLPQRRVGHAGARYPTGERARRGRVHRLRSPRDRGVGSVGTRFDQQLGQADLLVRHGEVGAVTSGALGARVQARGIVTGGSLRTPSTDDYGAAVFLVEEAALGRVRLQGGLRYDWARYEPRERAFVRVGDDRFPTDPRTFGAFSGSLGALLEAGYGVQVGASLARAYRTPDINELYSDGPHLAAYIYEVGNPRLGRETGVGADAFVRLTRGAVRGEVAAFRNALSGYVYPRNTGLLGRQGGARSSSSPGATRCSRVSTARPSGRCRARWSSKALPPTCAACCRARPTRSPPTRGSGLPHARARAPCRSCRRSTAGSARVRAAALVRRRRRARHRAPGATRRLRDTDRRLRRGRPHDGRAPASSARSCTRSRCASTTCSTRSTASTCRA